MSSEAARGQVALDKREYQTAVTHLTAALKSSQSPTWLIQRSTAYQRLGKHELALADADNAVLAAIGRQKRELIATAHFRRAVALHGMKRYGDARLCLNWCRKLNDKEKGLGIWQAKVKKDYDDAGGEDAEMNVCTVKEIPDKVEEVTVENTVDVKGKMAETTTVPAPLAAAAPTQTPKEKIRHEFYQSTEKVTITIFAKGVPKDKAEVTIKEGYLAVSFPILESGSTYDLTFDPLFAPVDPAMSSFRITPHKIEILLHKSSPGIKWSTLEGTEPINSSEEAQKPKIPTHILSPTSEKAPAYPTSSRKGPKDWDALATSALKSKSGNGGKGVEEGEDGGDAMEDFFKTLYKNADPDTKRAMIKSFQESNGTALSTNWSEVGKAPVKTQPPDGVEAKKWDT